MPASFREMLDAFEFSGPSIEGEVRAYLNKQSGKVYLHAEFSDVLDELPDDIDDDEKYIQLPDKRELALGKPLVLDFARQFLADDVDEVRWMFGGKGAYAR